MLKGLAIFSKLFCLLIFLRNLVLKYVNHLWSHECGLGIIYLISSCILSLFFHHVSVFTLYSDLSLSSYYVSFATCLPLSSLLHYCLFLSTLMSPLSALLLHLFDYPVSSATLFPPLPCFLRYPVSSATLFPPLPCLLRSPVSSFTDPDPYETV